MALHLNYDGKQNNGIIFNDTYEGALFRGAEFKPDIGEPYDSFQLSDVISGLDYIELDGVKRVLSEDQINILTDLAVHWIQPLGQEGNPTPEQAQAMAIAHLKNLYLGVVDSKLKELDYDSLATVQIWQGDVTYGAESAKILDWYRSVVAYNDGLIAAGVMPESDEAYLAGIPEYV